MAVAISQNLMGENLLQISLENSLKYVFIRHKALKYIELCFWIQKKKEFVYRFVSLVQLQYDCINPKGCRGEGQMSPTVRRQAANSHRNHLKVSKLLTFPKIMLTQRQYSHIEHILNDCPEIGPSSSQTYKIFEANFRKVDFFKPQ